jgi:hypothetical protein
MSIVVYQLTHVNVEKTAPCFMSDCTTSEFHESSVRIWKHVMNVFSSELNLVPHIGHLSAFWNQNGL